uniref:Uncharacterized protein n=1 Tax=Oryza meridionalis TaxID=40149 RepID=A0A0E0DT10_9ORYZ
MNVNFATPGEKALHLADWWLQERLCCRTRYRENFDTIQASGVAEDIKEEFLCWKEAGIIAGISEADFSLKLKESTTEDYWMLK